MTDQWRYRGRTIHTEDVSFIRELIARNPHLSRRKLSVKLCEAWQWRQANGALRDMVCRGLLLMLHRAGAIELPRVRQVSPNPLARRDRYIGGSAQARQSNIRLIAYNTRFLILP